MFVSKNSIKLYIYYFALFSKCCTTIKFLLLIKKEKSQVPNHKILIKSLWDGAWAPAVFKNSLSELDMRPGLKIADVEQGLEQKKKKLRNYSRLRTLSDFKNHLKCLLKNKFPGPSPADSDSVGWRRDQGICLFDNLSDVVSQGSKLGSGGGSGKEDQVMPSKIKLEKIKFSTLLTLAFIHFQLKTHQNNQI